MKAAKSLILMFICFFIGITTAQTKTDKIFKKDNSTVDCSVTKVSDQTVEFTYPGEAVTNVLEASKISKIVFASGRTQTFDASETAQSASAPTPSNAPKANTIAVLPVPFVNSDNMTNSEEMAKFAQNDI